MLIQNFENTHLNLTLLLRQKFNSNTKIFIYIISLINIIYTFILFSIYIYNHMLLEKYILLDLTFKKILIYLQK